MTTRRPAHTRRDMAYVPLEYDDRLTLADLPWVALNVGFCLLFGFAILAFVLVVGGGLDAVPA